MSSVSTTSWKVPCKACGTKLRISKPELIGKKARCPKCQAAVVITGPPKEPKPSAAAKSTRPPQSKSEAPAKPTAKQTRPTRKKSRPAPVESALDDLALGDLSLEQDYVDAPAPASVRSRRGAKRKSSAKSRKAKSAGGPPIAIIAGSAAALFLLVGGGVAAMMFLPGDPAGPAPIVSTDTPAVGNPAVENQVDSGQASEPTSPISLDSGDSATQAAETPVTTSPPIATGFNSFLNPDGTGAGIAPTQVATIEPVDNFGDSGAPTGLPTASPEPAAYQPSPPVKLASLETSTLEHFDGAVHSAKFNSEMRPFIETYCTDCHGDFIQEAKFRVDDIDGDLLGGPDRHRWSKILRRVADGEMPPPEGSRPSDKDRTEFVRWLREGLIAGETAELDREGRVATRRLNRVEYENTMRDLLGVQSELQSLLPEDGESHGFDSVADGLSISTVLMERYLEAADVALDAALPKVQPPSSSVQTTRWVDSKRFKQHLGKAFAQRGDYGIFFNRGGYPPKEIYDLNVPSDGKYRLTFNVYAHQPDGLSLAMDLYAGGFFNNQTSRTIGFFDVTGTQQNPGQIVVETDLKQGDRFQIDVYGTWTGRQFQNHVRKRKKKPNTFPGPGLAVGEITLEGPLDVQWPPDGYQKLYQGVPFAKVGEQQVRQGGKRVQVPVFGLQPRNAKADAGRLLADFVPKAFRRPVDSQTIQPYIQFVNSRLDQGYDFETAMKAGFKAVLASPQFLFLNLNPGESTQHDLASRLSYFLWSSMPDEELITLADQGRLADKSVLHDQVERMLGDPRSERFIQNFVGQWLDLREIEATMPDSKLYPEFDSLLQDSMVRESEAFFRELLAGNMSLLNVVDSDFVMLNERLAMLYDINGVRGYETLQRVSLPKNSVRGGVMTQASVLKVTANGTNTSPVLRGTWLLENVLGSPPPPPPPVVPAVEPDIRGATTIREQLAKHRADPACAGCHAKIDPPGFALENFDVMGRYRDRYRSLGQGDNVVDPKSKDRMPFKLGPAVNAQYQLQDGRKFRDVREYKELILSDPDQIARNMTEKLMTYAIARGPSHGDEPEIEHIIEKVKGKNYGLRTLIHEIVASPTFLDG
ncbi:DUF1592 domain-containing protein [Stratiformator vulcanicus]|uniref:Planctomycete cytochrome C n=1 Tax=Stratiformator vulcanicus TaxID=2527980 RepID=A0A517R7R5_9PLAN|nr:DUF1592 domain-containing protein [Stratiformator vulcanicus]QDT39930.1 hypothetical protein Pan189_43420 [Stratiformator vulcanicus]